MRPPVAKPTEVLSGSLDVLNLRYSKLVSNEFTPIENWNLVTDAYPEAQPGQSTVGKRMVNFTQHCEITLALNMLERRTQLNTRPKIEIGVSKACCEWCYEYLTLLPSSYSNQTILVRASHGKQPDGWMMPPKSKELVAKEMERVIEERIDDVIWKIRGRRRSDSNELPDLAMGEPDFEASKQDIAEDNLGFARWNA